MPLPSVAEKFVYLCTNSTTQTRQRFSSVQYRIVHALSHTSSLSFLCVALMGINLKRNLFARWTFNPAVLTKVQSPLVPSGGVVVGLPGAASPPSPLGVLGAGPIEPTTQACRYITFLHAFRIPMVLKWF